MGAMFIGQQFLQNVLGYSTLQAGLAIIPAAVCMVLVAPRSAKIVEARGARFTLLSGYFFCLLGFLTMLLLWKEDISYWKVGLGYALHRDRRRARRHAGLALADRLGAGEARGHGVGHGRPAARPRRRDHAVDLRRAPDGRLRDGGRGRDLVGAEQRQGQRQRPSRSSRSRSTARRRSRSSTRSTRARSRPPRSSRSSTATRGPTRPASSRSSRGAALIYLCFPGARGGGAAARRLPRGGHRRARFGRVRLGRSRNSRANRPTTETSQRPRMV